MVIDGVPNLTGLVDVLVYDTNSVHFILMCCNGIKWVQKTRQVYDLMTDMVCDSHFLCLDVKYLYNHTITLVRLSDQPQNIY